MTATQTTETRLSLIVSQLAQSLELADEQGDTVLAALIEEARFTALSRLEALNDFND